MVERALVALRRLVPPESFLRRLARYGRITLRQAHEDSIWLIASALALVTLLSLIPLLAAFSYIGARVFSQYPQRSLEVFIQILPYSEKSLVDALTELLNHAEGIHGIGVLFFFTSSLFLFVTVEKTINRIWNVVGRRPWPVRLFSFALFIAWGPILVGATFTSLLLLRQSPALRHLAEESSLLALAPFAASLVGLTVLYWLVPDAPVRLRNALAGGLLAAILLEMLRQGFALYVELFSGFNAMYGGLTFAILFIISLDLTWGIVLLGCEAAYTAQHFRLLSRGLHRNPPVQAAWVGLATLALIARRLLRGEPPLSREELADHLTLPQRELERILHPLIAPDLLRPAGSRGYRLAVEPQDLPLEHVFAAYDHRARRGVGLPGGELTGRLEELVRTVSTCRADHLAGQTLADLAGGSAEPPEISACPPPPT